MPDKAPAFQFYPDKWLAGTGHLSPEAYMAYHRLLCWLWLHGKNHCSMKDTTEMWKIATGMNGNSLTSAKKEIMSPDFSLLRKRGVNVFSKGLQKESEKQQKRSQQSKDAIKARWDRELGRYGRNTGVLRPLYPPSLTTYNKRIMSDAIEKHGADAVNLSVLLGSYIYRNHDKPNVKPYDWPLVASRMLRLDGRTPKEIANLIKWTQNNEFEMNNVLSMGKLRERWTNLSGKMRSDVTKPPAKVPGTLLRDEYVPTERDEWFRQFNIGLMWYINRNKGGNGEPTGD